MWEANSLWTELYQAFPEPNMFLVSSSLVPIFYCRSQVNLICINLDEAPKSDGNEISRLNFQW